MIALLLGVIMIQRIQTVYLLIAVILMVVCSCLPVGNFLPEGMGATLPMYNLCIIEEDGWEMIVIGLFFLLAASTTTSVMAIFGFNNRKAQAKKCTISILLLFLWAALYAVMGWVVGVEGYTFRMEMTAVLPLISIILIWMARRAIIADEKLVRSVDRIR